jgi:hypothetical protein
VERQREVLSECGTGSGRERERETEGNRRKEQRIVNVIWEIECRIGWGLIPAMQVGSKNTLPKVGGRA